MKKLFTLVALLCATFTAVHAQNIQFHFNAGKYLDKTLQGKNRGGIVTLEHLSFDPWGQTFYFVDLDLGFHGISDAYTEISRELRFWKAPIAIHLEYNGGVSKDFMLNNTFLTGASYLWSKEGNAFSLSMMYRHDYKLAKPHNMQLTAVWSWTSWNKVFTLNGFADLWSANNIGNVIFLSEPQAWINLNQFVGVHDNFNLSVGTEVRLAYNFVHSDKFWVRPSLALKWNF